MKDVRNLLLDCRSALRRSNLRSQDELRDRLEAALIELGKAGEAGADADTEELAEPETRAAQQVAFAWQIAARTLRLTHPELHAKLFVRVHEMLDANVLHDPAIEILELQSKLESAAGSQQSVADELAALYKALANAVPLVGRDAIGSDSECAYRRLDMLVKAAASGGGLPKAPAADNPIDGAHTREELQAVVDGRRQLSRWERAWCYAEALVMTGMTTDELHNMQDVALVKLVLSGSSDPSMPTPPSG